MQLIVEIQTYNTHTFALVDRQLKPLLLLDVLLPQENLYVHDQNYHFYL